MNRKKNRSRRVAQLFILVAASVIALSPFYVALCYAFKSRTEFVRTKQPTSSSERTTGSIP